MPEEFRAIQTHYKGRVFRSRLEARWAVVFDAMAVEWRYEPQGMVLRGVPYLPDFYLPQQAIWLEIKGALQGSAKNETLWKAKALAEQQRRRVMIVHGDIPYPYPNPDGSTPSALCIFPSGDQSWPYWWCICPWCGRLGIEANGRAEDLPCGCATTRGIRSTVETYCAPVLQAAYAAGHAARFEHGERPGQPRATEPDNGIHTRDRAFMDRFPQPARSTLANRMLAPIRGGITDPAAAIEAVRRECNRNLQASWRYRDRMEPWVSEGIQKERRILDNIKAYPEEARALAGYYIAYEALPRAEQQRLKARGHAETASDCQSPEALQAAQSDFITHLLSMIEGCQ